MTTVVLTLRVRIPFPGAIMQKLIALAAFLALAIPATQAADDDAAKAAKKLEGTYELISATRGGKPDGDAKDVESFTIKDGKIIIKLKDAGKETNAKFTLDPSKKPAHIDLAHEVADQTSKGIYEAKDTDKGLELSISIALPRGDGERPKDFKGDAENEISLKLLRKKAK